jgi:hypothetical protein
MKNDDELVKRLDEAIYSSGSAMGPALTNLILHGPIDRSLVSGDNLAVLKDNADSFEDAYNRWVFPKIGEIAGTVAKYDFNLPGDRRGLNRFFKKKASNNIRTKFRNSYDGQFDLDSTTREALFSKEEIRNGYGERSKYFFNKDSQFMLSKRYKKTDEVIKKYNTNFDKLGDDEKDNFLGFAVDVAENSHYFWRDHCYYSEKYGKETLDMMLGDMFGIKIVDMDLKRAEVNMDRLAKSGPAINFRHFLVVKRLFEDHRGRRENKIPGGVHYTLVDKTLPNYPLEVQFRSIEDECLNLFGENSHYLYGLSGKKGSESYCG